MAMPRPTSDLSADVVICAYTEDRWDMLCRAVASVQEQSTVPGQILVCVDHNEELYERCMERWGAAGATGQPTVRVLRNRFAGRLGSARNTAVEQVDADVVAFLDDDAEAAPTWLETLLQVYRDHPEAVAVGGAPLPNHRIERPGWFPHEFDWVFGCHYEGLPDQLAPVRHLIGASMSVRTDALWSVGGFHSDKHDDMDLSHRVAAAHGSEAVLYEPKAQISHVVHAERLTWSYFWRRCYWINRSKVRAFHDMGDAGNITAELQFARRMAASVARKLLRALRGDTDALGQAAAIVAGLGAAGVGHLQGKLELRLGRLPVSLTTGLERR